MNLNTVVKVGAVIFVVASVGSIVLVRKVFRS
jgi:hypothetical protein